MRIIDIVKTFKIISKKPTIVSVNGVTLSGYFCGDTEDLIFVIRDKIETTSAKDEDIHYILALKQDTDFGWANLLFFNEYFVYHKIDFCEIYPLDEFREQDESYLVLKYSRIILEDAGAIKCV